MDQYIEFISNHYFLFGGLAVVTVLLIQDIFESLLRKYDIATPLFTVGLMDNDDTLILDVREPQEHAKGFIERSLHIPAGKLDDRINELEPFKSHPIVVTCQSGTRSPQTCKKLQKLGFEKIFLLKGGIQGWEDLSLPVKRKKKR